MRSLLVAVCFLLAPAFAFAQGDRGTITGNIADPAGAVVAGAMVEARNTDTGGIYPTQSTGTGNYTLSELPAGPYEISVTVPGFKKYVRQSVTVYVAQTYRIDVTLEVGSNAESVTSLDCDVCCGVVFALLSAAASTPASLVNPCTILSRDDNVKIAIIVPGGIVSR